MILITVSNNSCYSKTFSLSILGSIALINVEYSRRAFLTKPFLAITSLFTTCARPGGLTRLLLHYVPGGYA
jgi:hypothetical protein